MENKDILARIDHTLLKAVSGKEDILKLCTEAIKFKTASVCISPSYVKLARDNFPSLNICTVIGFPLGYSTTQTKVFETENAIQNGADEIDMVINITDVKNGDFNSVTDEISAVRKAAEGKILKVIIEACYLDESEKIKLCGCVSDAGADYIKTSTGFGSGGADKNDIILFKKHIADRVKIKAAGGIRTRADMEEYIELGCDRIGTSNANILFD